MNFVGRAPLRWSEAAAVDWRAGWISAVIMLPQAVVLATLAGMPTETGIYTSVFPVIIAAVCGWSPRLLSGPNTAVALMVADAISPFATANSADYVALALALTAMVGLVQLLAAAARLGRLFDAMPDCIIHGITLGIGMVILITQLPVICGVLAVPGQAPWVSLWHAAATLPRLNPYAVAVSILSISAAVVLARRRRWRRTMLLVALVAGTATAFTLDCWLGADTTDLERVGYLSLSVLPLSVPKFSWDQFYVLKQLLQSAIAIAMIGALQTVIIARSISSLDERKANPNRELVAQGLANIVASFTSGFAGSGSFNRSAAHVQAGARTPGAAVLSALILFALVFAGGRLFAQIPLAAMAGALMLVGWGLLRSAPWTTIRAGGKSSLWATLAIALLVVAGGLETALFWACAAGLAVLVWKRACASSDPNRPPASNGHQNEPRSARASPRVSFNPARESATIDA